MVMFAEFERAMLRERHQNGLLAARAVGRIDGRSKLAPWQQREVVQLVKAGQKTAAAARLFNVHPSTIARLLSRHRASSRP